MFNGYARHGKVVNVRCRYGSSDSVGRGRDQTIGLVERDASLGELTPPRSSAPTLGDAQRCQP